ncbi:hypothetical protein GCM10017559_32290 [Streptosporangium longisporum]|uniref:Serine/threonine protein kinase n=2 Tax=Streptosporangium longisporum TaxID=46187 RepID=A0ABN3Y187_9ACTN
MSGDRGDLGGFRLTGRTWADDVGVWSSVVSADGRPGSALRFDPRTVADPAARERLVAAVVADRRLAQGGPNGLVPVADLLMARGEVWLITSLPVVPTLGDLLSGVPGAPAPDAGSAATVLVETAQALLALHAAGLSHGEFHPGTVVIASDGSALLAKRGLADALSGRPSLPERDVAAWASLARGLAAGWAADDPEGARLLERVAARASARGLAPARDALVAGREVLPAGFATRDRLVQTLHLWSAPEAGRPASGRAGPGYRAAGHPAAGQPVPGYPAPEYPVSVPDEGEIVTLLRVPGETDRHGPPPSERPPPEQRSEDVVMRFGPGVPSETTAAQLWRAGRDLQQTQPPAERLRAVAAPRERRRRGRTVLASAILALMVVAALALWLLRGPVTPLEVTGVSVSAPKGTQRCDAKIRIVGVLTTNGSAGEVRYQWKRSDRRKPIVQNDRLAAGTTSHEVVLDWTVKGEGDFRGTATLLLLSPSPATGKIQDKASFTYKC